MSIVIDPHLKTLINATVSLRDRTVRSDGLGGDEVTARPYTMANVQAVVTQLDAAAVERLGYNALEVQWSVLLPVSVDGVNVPVDKELQIVIVTPSWLAGRILYATAAKGPQIGIKGYGRFVWYLCRETR